MEIDWILLAGFAVFFAALITGGVTLVNGYLNRKSERLRSELADQSEKVKA